MITVSLNADSKCLSTFNCIKRSRSRSPRAEGRLTAGERLPSKRALSAHLKISVLTVENAYGQLCDEGYVCPKAGSGYYVERLLPRSPYAKKTLFKIRFRQSPFFRKRRFYTTSLPAAPTPPPFPSLFGEGFQERPFQDRARSFCPPVLPRDRLSFAVPLPATFRIFEVFR